MSALRIRRSREKSVKVSGVWLYRQVTVYERAFVKGEPGVNSGSSDRARGKNYVARNVLWNI